MYEFKYRMDDPQTGRFWQIDPLSDKYVYNSTYAFSENKVTSHVELEGLESVDIHSAQYQGLMQDSKDPNALKKNVQALDNGASQGNAQNVKSLPGLAIMAAVIFQPEVGIPLALSYLTGMPVTPSPQAMATSGIVAAEETAAATSGEEMVTVYRGVNESHPGYQAALKGNAAPRGGTATAAEHNAGNTQSNLTSWTTNEQVAENYALRPDGSGVVLKTTLPRSNTTVSPNNSSIYLKQSPGTYVNESEVLIKGPVSGAQSRIVPIF